MDAERIGQLRTAMGWTQRELARRSGVSVTNIGDIERGKAKKPYPRTLEALYRALEAPSEAPPSDRRAIVREVLRELEKTGRLLSVTDQPRRPRQLPELVLSGDERDVWSPAAAARILRGEEPQEDPRFPAVPPPEHEDDLGPDPIGIEVEGWSLIGAGIYEGDVAWVNPDDLEPEYGEGSVVIADVRAGQERLVVIKEVGAGNRLYSVTEDGRQALKVDEVRIIARVVCMERRRKVWAPGA